MKKIISLTLSLSLISILAVSTSVVVFAKEGSEVNTTSTIKPTEIRTTRVTESEAPDKSGEPRETESPKPSDRVTKTAEDTNDAQKCDRVNGNVNGLLQKYQNSKTENESKYSRTIDQLTKISSALKTKGLDTTDLDKEIATLKTKVQKFSTDIQTLIDQLKTFPDVRCHPERVKLSETPKPSETPKLSPTSKVQPLSATKTPSPIPAVTSALQGNNIKLDPSLVKKVETSKLVDLRNLLTTVKNDMDEIKNYYKDVIKPTIIDLRKQLETNVSTTPAATLTPTTQP